MIYEPPVWVLVATAISQLGFLGWMAYVLTRKP